MQGRHPRQTSDASGAAASQVGPRAVALATQLNKQLGLPYGKTAVVLRQAFGLEVTRGGVCQAIRRTGRKAEPTYQGLIEQIRTAPSVTPDETGWKVGGRLWWLWAFVSEEVTVYSIPPGRGFEQGHGGAAARLRWRTATGWIQHLPAFSAGLASDLPGTPAAALPRDDRGVRSGGAVSADREGNPAKGPAMA